MVTKFKLNWWKMFNFCCSFCLFNRQHNIISTACFCLWGVCLTEPVVCCRVGATTPHAHRVSPGRPPWPGWTGVGGGSGPAVRPGDGEGVGVAPAPQGARRAGGDRAAPDGGDAAVGRPFARDSHRSVRGAAQRGRHVAAVPVVWRPASRRHAAVVAAHLPRAVRRHRDDALQHGDPGTEPGVVVAAALRVPAAVAPAGRRAAPARLPARAVLRHPAIRAALPSPLPQHDGVHPHHRALDLHLRPVPAQRAGAGRGPDVWTARQRPAPAPAPARHLPVPPQRDGGDETGKQEQGRALRQPTGRAEGRRLAPGSQHRMAPLLTTPCTIIPRYTPCSSMLDTCLVQSSLSIPLRVGQLMWCYCVTAKICCCSLEILVRSEMLAFHWVVCPLLCLICVCPPVAQLAQSHTSRKGRFGR